MIGLIGRIVKRTFKIRSEPRDIDGRPVKIYTPVKIISDQGETGILGKVGYVIPIYPDNGLEIEISDPDGTTTWLGALHPSSVRAVEP